MRAKLFRAVTNFKPTSKTAGGIFIEIDDKLIGRIISSMKLMMTKADDAMREAMYSE